MLAMNATTATPPSPATFKFIAIPLAIVVNGLSSSATQCASPGYSAPRLECLQRNQTETAFLFCAGRRKVNVNGRKQLGGINPGGLGRHGLGAACASHLPRRQTNR